MGGFRKAGNHAQQGRLAAAGGAQYGKKLTIRNFERHIVYGHEIFEGLGDVLDRQINFHKKPNASKWEMDNLSRKQQMPPVKRNKRFNRTGSLRKHKFTILSRNKPWRAEINPTRNPQLDGINQGLSGKNRSI
jgi:hypothetical protein